MRYQELQSEIYYHGTPSFDDAKKIMKNGLKPSSRISHFFTMNVAHRGIYLSPSKQHATEFAINAFDGNVKRAMMQFGKYGYLFSVNKQDLIEDVEIDEGFIGVFAKAVFQYINHQDISSNYPNQWIDFIEENFSWANDFYNLILRKEVPLNTNFNDTKSFGRKINKRMSTLDKEVLFKLDPPIAYKSAVNISNTWRIDRATGEKTRL